MILHFAIKRNFTCLAKLCKANFTLEKNFTCRRQTSLAWLANGQPRPRIYAIGKLYTKFPLINLPKIYFMEADSERINTLPSR